MAHPMLLLAWLAVGLALAQGQTYPAFLRKHVDYPRTTVAPYCNVMMQRRGMTTPCKRFNTFIHANTTDIIDICGPGGTPVPGTNLHNSSNAFDLTDCDLQGATPRPPCRYREIPNLHSRIQVACTAGRPVHFQRKIP
ncbi:ribonuclease-like [Pelodiscus sinensis]|uniref:ribonuclease-like n=1 Tax=Pelodiscus sinensis TaxID=13735 RepID=UPI003F6D482D